MSTNRAVQLHEHSIKSPSSACSIGDAPVPTPAQVRTSPPPAAAGAAAAVVTSAGGSGG